MANVVSIMGTTIAKIRIIMITADTICFVFLLFILNIIEMPPFHTERILYMKLPFFASFIVFCVWLSLQLKKGYKRQAAQEKSFWDREAAANSTRRKSLDGLEYIHIPESILSMDALLPLSPEEKTESSFLYKGREAMETLHNLSGAKIVNLTGFTNTELKLKYGAPNILLLTEYDQNYTLLARTLQTLAETLYRLEKYEEAMQVLLFAISTKTDVSQSYYLLADLYIRQQTPEKKEELLHQAEQIPTMMKKPIVRTLQGSGPYSDLLRSL